MLLSVIIITKDAELTIGRCLKSVDWADEIVVVDFGSTDRTLDICRELGAKVQQTADWPGFGPQKNRALELAGGSWVLSLDADEWVSPGLRAEIEGAMAAPGNAAAFAMPRRSSFCGRFLRHGGWWPDRVVRLFRRGSARFSEARVHERIDVRGAVGRLQSPIMHESIRDPAQALEKINRYSSDSARMLADSGRRVGIATAIVHGLWAFIRTYFLRLGFLDGREGFAMAVYNAEASYYRYLKLMYLNEAGDR